jgi:hypothetical protein
MSNEVIVHKNRRNVIRVDLGMDVSADTLTSQIRTQPDVNSPLIVEWEVEFETDGEDGKLILTLDDTVTADIPQSSGYMDILRVSGSEPLPVFDRPLEVSFRGTVTEWGGD